MVVTVQLDRLQWEQFNSARPGIEYQGEGGNYIFISRAAGLEGGNNPRVVIYQLILS